MRYELNQRETKNDLDVKCEFIRDEKIDYIVKLNFYKKALIHIMNQDNYKKVSLILQQLDIIYQSLLYDSDTEHLIYRKVLTLLEQDNLSEEEFGQISTLLYNIDEAYLYRSAYEKDIEILPSCRTGSSYGRYDRL